MSYQSKRVAAVCNVCRLIRSCLSGDQADAHRLLSAFIILQKRLGESATSHYSAYRHVLPI